MVRSTRNNPLGQGRSSYLLLHWATQIAKSMLESSAYDDLPFEEVLQLAFATANKRLSENDLRVEGTNKLTKSGKLRERELLKRHSPEEIEHAYAALAQYD